MELLAPANKYFCQGFHQAVTLCRGSLGREVRRYPDAAIYPQIFTEYGLLSQ